MTGDVAIAVSDAERALAVFDLGAASDGYRRAWKLSSDRSTLGAAQIRKWQANIAAWRGRFHEARKWYDQALEILSPVAAYDSDAQLERARCLLDRAQLEQQAGRFTLSSRLLGRALSAAPGDSDECREITLLMVGLEALKPGGYEAARALLGGVSHAVETMSDPGAAVRLLECRALVSAMDGGNSAAAALLGEADALLVGGDQRVAAQVAHNLASIRLAQGNPAVAAELLARVVAFYGKQFTLLRIAAEVDQGMVQLALGEVDRAIGTFAQADADLESEEAIRLRARALDGWGSALQAKQDLAGAAERHEEAIRLIRIADARERADGWTGPPWAALDQACALTNLATDHLLTRRYRYSIRAKELFTEADGLFELGPPSHPERARCKANLGVAHAFQGESANASRCFEEASTQYQSSNRTLGQAAVNHNRGCLIADGVHEGDESLSYAALELLIPAALIRDAVRFSLPEADQRGRWWEQQACASLSRAFEVATRVNDARLVAELIACFRLAGALGVQPPVGGEHDTTASALEVLPGLTGQGPEDSLLRLHRGPMIRLAGDRVALSHYLRVANDVYKVSVRTGSLVVFG